MKKNNGDLQYIADSILIEKLFLIDAGLAISQNVDLHKEAGVSDLLGGIASGVMDWGKKHVDTSSVGSTLTSLADLMAPGVLFRVHPLLGGLATVSTVLGFSVSNIVRKVLAYLKPKLEAGESVSAQEINEVGKAAVAAEAGPLDSTASNDMFYHLREIEKRGELVRLVKDAAVFGNKSRGPGMISNIFMGLRRGRAMWLLGAFAIWILKTILIGAGLIAAGEAVYKMFGGQPKSEVAQQPAGATYKAQEDGEAVPVATSNPSKLKPSGKGQDNHTNDHTNSVWVVPMVGGSVDAMLLTWASYVYPELSGKESVIESTPSFNKTVDMMSRHLEAGKQRLKVPQGLNSIKQVVDMFAGDVANKL